MSFKRLYMQTLLEEVLGTRNVYFDPPVNLEMKYPAIVYERQNIKNDFASNKPYLTREIYKITYIRKEADPKKLEDLSKLLHCKHKKSFTANNLYHSVFEIYL